MPKLIIEINMEGAAFDEEEIEMEVSRLLSVASSKFSDAMGYDPDVEDFKEKLLDINGNTCGSVRLES